MPELIQVSVKGLLGHFDHSFSFPPDSEFIILHGPNGIGKTKLLELISATLKANALKIASIPFSEANFDFDDGTNLRITLETDEASGASVHVDEDEKSEHSKVVHFHLTRQDGKPIHQKVPTWAPEIRRAVAIISREFPFLSRLGDDMWIDTRDGEELSTSEVLDRYSRGYLFESRRSAVRSATWPSKDERVRKFLQSLSVHFIETQRLLTEGPSDGGPRDPRAPRTAVSRLATDLKRRLDEAHVQNSRAAQQLDRDFPRRLLDASYEGTVRVTDKEIKQKYEAQSSLRRQLATYGLAEDRDDLPLPTRTLQDWESRVLWIYLNDTEQRLETFLPILERATLLAEIINSRFLFKKLVIDKDHGFKITTDSGTELSPHMLSSGEQHELVLVYNLIFQAKEGSLVLIDEPEISLHAAWQKAFLGDIQRIAQVSSLRFIIATHSPQIINKWWSRAIGLHPQEDEEADE